MLRKKKKEDVAPKRSENWTNSKSTGETTPKLMDIKPKPTPTAVPQAGHLKLTSQQFVQARGIRWERAAGFIAWVKREYGVNHRLTTLEWVPVWEIFQKEPAGRPKH